MKYYYERNMLCAGNGAVARHAPGDMGDMVVTDLVPGDDTAEMGANGVDP